MNEQDFIQSLETDTTAAEIENAKATLAGIGEKVRFDIRVLGHRDILDALFTLKAFDALEYISVEKEITRVGKLGKKELATILANAEAQFNAGARMPVRNRNAGKMLCDYFQNSPIATLIIPPEYNLSHEGTFQTINPKLPDILLSHGAVIISGRTEDIEGESFGVRLSWTRDGHSWSHKVVNRSIVADARQLVTLADSNYPVTSGQAKDQSEYLANLEAVNYSELPKRITTSRFGWQGQSGAESFLVGKSLVQPDGEVMEASLDADSGWQTGNIIFRGNSPGEQQIVEGYHSSGNYGDWINAVTKAAEYPIVWATIAAGVVPPLLDILGCPNFIFSLDGVTSLGKSVSQIASGSTWGYADENAGHSVFQSWDTTMYAVQHRAAVCNFLALFLDDTKRARRGRNDVDGKQKIVADVIYLICRGTGGALGQPRGIRAVKEWRTVLVSSGEMPITLFTEDGGTRMRTISINHKPFGGQNKKIGAVVTGLKEQFQANYGFAGVRYLQFIQRNRDKWNDWKAEYEKLRQAYTESATSEKSGRLATYVAAVSIAAKLFHQSLELPFKFYFPLDHLWSEISGQAEDAVGADRAFRHIIEWCERFEQRFIGREPDARMPSSGWAGRWIRNDNQIAIFPSVLHELLLKIGFQHPEGILSQWKEKDFLICNNVADRNCLTKKITIKKGEGQQPMYVLNYEKADRSFDFDENDAPNGEADS